MPLEGPVASRAPTVAVAAGRGWRDEAPPSRSTCLRDEHCIRWFPVPSEAILLAVRWYLRYGLSYRDLEELLAERGIEVDHVTLYRLVQRFTPLIVDAARSRRHAVGDRWFVDETYVKVSGTWRYVTAPWTSMGRSSTPGCRRSVM